MEAMSPQQDNVGQHRSSSLTGEPKLPGITENKKKMKSLAQRRQSAPSLVLSKALNKSRTISKESCFSPVSPETCPLVQTFLCPSRAFILHSPVQLKTGLQTQDRHLFLFTDIMIIAKSKSQSHYKLKNHVRVSEMWTASCMEEVCEGSTYPERSFVLGWPITNCVATFSTPEEKEKCLAVLQRRISEEKESDHPKIIPLKIITKDIGNCAYSKTITVTNEDSVIDVIRMAQQAFGIEGSATDYQLWVTSGKDDAPYPLIGHEYPYGIKMSHIRDAVPVNTEGLFLMEQLPREMQCQFILKPSRLAVCHHLSDPSQKPYKRKRSIINWTFWRGSNSHLDNVPLSPTSSAPGKLFGISLPSICENDNLPKPILDMLAFLCQEGPFTRGIFRRSANVKSCKEMKERLDSGGDVNFSCESVFVTASVFKDFLRNIPGGIFSSKLYDKWISVMDQGSEQDKIISIQKLLEKLPQVNVLLLRYLFGVLHCIEEHSETNQMTAFNLAVCIAPSLLWLPSPSTAEIEGEFTRKVSVLVQFLIENCSMIFEDDISLLYEHFSAKDDNREDISDVCSFKQIDSSYDSLENELNDEADSPISGPTKKLGCNNRSRDSVLSLSDCDLDHPDTEESQTELGMESHPHRLSTVLHHTSASHEQSENESLCSNTSGYSSTTDALKDLRRPRRCSEPAIGILVSRFSHLNESPHENAVRKASCDDVLSQSADEYLKQHLTLQVEGQKLIDRSLTLGINVGKTSNKKRTADNTNTPSRLLPPSSLRLNICSRTSCSSLSSPGTSPSGSSLSSLDSAFSQFSDYSVLTPNEVPSPLDCPVRSYKKQLELTPDFSFVGFTIDENEKQSHKNNSLITGKDGVSRSCHPNSVNIHAKLCLNEATPTVKNWPPRTKEKVTGQDGKHKIITTVTYEEPQEISFSISEEPFFQKQMNVPKTDFESKLHFSCTNHESCKQDASLNSLDLFYENGSKRKLAVKHLVIDKDTVEKDGTSTNNMECSSFLFPSPVSINIEISSQSQNTLIPQTFFYGQDFPLYNQSQRRQSTNSFSVDEPRVLTSTLKSCSEQSINVGEDSIAGAKDVTTKSTIGRDISIRVANFKKNKILPSNVDTGLKIANCDLEKNFCVSPKQTTTTADFFFQPEMHKNVQQTQECVNTVIQKGQEWQLKRCTDSKFEDIDQSFFAEESYV
ncbi:rho GTPase-activating protein 20 [Bombina bombina]|uniref:rho GTPase-activating protein 20 n=1 Tax=Bombina bombina TaxID=8345 RepID=UPI00235B0BCC|nr:rho GTPase-activating protein 20 [Bombina bombina]